MKEAAIARLGVATAVAGMALGCALSRPVPALPSVAEFTVERPRDEVFDAALAVAQTLNANVAVLEKGSGFVRFEAATLTPAQLDRYCRYPWVNAQTLAPWDTFQGWNQRALASGAGRVRGTVTLTLLLEARPGSTKGTLRGNWAAQTNTEVQPCNSLGVLEKELETALRKHLAQRQAVPAAESSGTQGLFDATVVRIKAAHTLGSGFFVTKDLKDLIATNAHVVRGSEQVRIAFTGGTEQLGSVVYRDNELDFALVRSSVESTPLLLRKTPLVDGESVMAVGFPQGRRTVAESTGTVRKIVECCIEHDALVAGGSSGGPLLDAGSNVVGINTVLVKAKGDRKNESDRTWALKMSYILESLSHVGDGQGP